jgi:subtilisin family serine protease
MSWVLVATASPCLLDKGSVLKAVPASAGNQGRSMMSSSPANCPSALAVTSVSDYDGMPGALSTPANETDLDDTFTDFSNWGNNDTASRTIAGPGAQRLPAGGGMCWDEQLCAGRLH